MTPSTPRKPAGRTRRKRIRIVIADDHMLVRDGLRTLLRQQQDFAVVGEAANGEDALAIVASVRPDILLVDLSMPSMSGLEVLRRLGGEAAVRPIVLTASIRQDEAASALAAGARGVVLKDVAPAILFKSIRAVMDGQYWLGREVVSNLAQIVSRAGTASRGALGLTPRQLEIVANIVAGRSNKEIATALSVSEETVKHHLTHIYDRLHICNRVELAVLAANRGLGPRAPERGPVQS